MSKKFAEEWADEWLNSEEGKELKEEMNKELLNYAVFGECAFKVLDEHVMEDLVEEFDIDASEVLETFKDELTQEQYEKLKKRL